MKKFLIDLINFNNCLKSNKDDLQFFEGWQNCGKLPFPSLRSNTDPEKAYAMDAIDL